uniref:Uncharacterized protein n=1 Tax=mine drainage metagenome TaxID=410659 RepID=E6PG17_9ZZZZ
MQDSPNQFGLEHAYRGAVAFVNYVSI